MADVTVDARGLACPMPIVKLTKAVKSLSVADTITIMADDPGFQPDVNAWVEAQGYEVDSLTEVDGVFTAVIIIR